MGKPLLEIKNVSKKFGGIDALKNVSFAIYPGQIVALLGDNGAGKSTIIKIISGYYQKDSGEIYWQGSKIKSKGADTPKEIRKLGIETVYQQLGLIDKLSILRNFFLGKELVKEIYPFKILDKKKMKAIIKTELEDFGIKRRLNFDDCVSALSGGERQAISFCRARYFKSKLLILDEPTSALSLRQTEEVLKYIKLAAQSNIAIILISHMLSQIQPISDRIIVMNQGEIAANFNSEEKTAKEIRELIIKRS